MSLTTSPTVKEGGAAFAAAAAVALELVPAPDAAGAAVSPGVALGVALGVVAGAGVEELVVGGGWSAAGPGGVALGELMPGSAVPPAGVFGEAARAWPATARARLAAMRGKAGRI